MIRVLVVDDSAVVRELLTNGLNSTELSVVGTAADGNEALAAVERLRPDVITMDIHMPNVDGVEATRRIMNTRPTPIVIVSGSTDPGEAAATFIALQAGAVAVLSRPPGPGHSLHEGSMRELAQTVRLMAEIKVIRRWSRPLLPPRAPVIGPIPAKVIAIGASTGGPPVLQKILEQLPRDLAAPVLVVQHMAAGFLGGFVEWLAQTSALPVELARHGMPALAGRVYVAPDDHHMSFTADGVTLLTQAVAEHGLRPAVSHLFRAIAECCGDRAVAGLLSGMGRDGAAELRQLRDRGALTFVQDKASAIVYGMPGEAVRLGAAALVLAPEQIAGTLAKLVRPPTQNRSEY